MTRERWLFEATPVFGFTIAIAALLIALVVADTTQAQISAGGSPKSFTMALRADVQTVEMPAVDVDALLREDEIEQSKGVPFRFGYGFDVEYSLENSGTWETLPDGGRVWRLNIVSPGAYSINLLYSLYKLPRDAEFYVYNSDHSMVIGAFTDRNNKDHGQMATGLVKGDAVTLEYYEPAVVEFPGKLAVSRIVHGYRNLFSNSERGYGSSGACNNNVNCPEGYPWRVDKRAVAMVLTSGGSRLCSGSMVNNVRQDETPYFLTANHCLGGETSWIFMFNYESPGCVNQDGPLWMTTQGSIRRANSSGNSDFGLLQLTEAPPDSYQVYFNGWNANNVNGDSAVGIHHPAGDIKKITFDYGTYTSTSYLGTTIDANATHWRIEQWEDGTTEGGSSGSPLYNKQHQVIGQLHGGYASCSSITSDWYGKFSKSWLGDGTSSTQLKFWLDPDNTGTLALDGFDPYAGVVISHTPLSDTKDTLNPYPVTCMISTDSALIADSLLLYYQLSSVWHKDTLQPTGVPSQYRGYIPPQMPGTVINYYLFAMSISGKADTTAIFSFRVTEVAAIVVSPMSYAKTLGQGDSTYDQLVIGNTGRGGLTYSLVVEPDLTPKLLFFENLRQAGRVNPATYDWPAYEEVKGEQSVRFGPKVLFDAGGPDGFGYVWVDSDEPGGPVFNWVDIELTGTNITTGLSDDNFVGPFPIGFTFPYYDSNYTQFYVASNGYIGFGPTTSYNSLSNGVLPSGSTPNNIICWCWDDLDITDADNPGGKVLMQNVGGDLVIQFEKYPEYDFAATPGDVITAEVILSPDGTIKIQYESFGAGFDLLGNTVGLENKNGTIGMTMGVNTAYIHAGLVVEIVKPAQWLSYDVASGSVPPGSADTVQLKFSAVDMDLGYYGAQIKVSSNDPDAGDNPLTIPATLTVVAPYMAGDANGDLIVNITDIVYILTYVFNSGPAPDPLGAGDANCDGLVNISDIVYLVQYIFNSGPAPCV